MFEGLLFRSHGAWHRGNHVSINILLLRSLSVFWQSVLRRVVLLRPKTGNIPHRAVVNYKGAEQHFSSRKSGGHQIHYPRRILNQLAAHPFVRCCSQFTSPITANHFTQTMTRDDSIKRHVRRLEFL